MTRDAATKITHRLRLIAIGVTAAGALITFIAVGFLFPAVGGSRSINVRSAWVNGPIIVADLLAFAYGYTRLRRRHVAEALRWLQEDRAPDGREHQLTLGLATYFVKWDALGWSLSAIGFALFNGFVFSWALAGVVAATIWFGGETTCALGYLLYERALRPVTALALAVRPTGVIVAPGVRLRLAMAWLLGTGVPLIGLIVLGVIGAAGWTHNSKYVGSAVLFL